jgi:hypothetical protein
MINIVFYFFMWITLPILISGFILLGGVSSTSYSNQLSSYSVTSGQAQEIVNTASSVGIGISAVLLVICLIVPIVYIYFWIVVNNLRSEWQLNSLN